MTATATTAETVAVEEAEITLAEFAKTNENRARSYRFLARLVGKEVDQEMLDTLRNTRFPMATGDEQVDAGNKLLASYLSNVWGGTLQELAVDYVRTFIGGGMDAFSAAYPYESVYTSPKRLMMQEARDEVLAIYRSQMLDKNKNWKESEDHLSVECEFMAEMAARTATACEEGDEAKVESLLKVQHNFLVDHLYAWSGMMTKDMRVFAQTDFYKGLAEYIDGFLASDVAMLKNTLGIEDEDDE